MPGKPRKKRPAKQLIYEGPVGKCSCCDRKTEIKIASPLGTPSMPGWVVPVETMRDLYHSVAALIRKRTQGGTDTLYVNDPDLRPARARTGWSLRRAKLFFVEGSDGQFAGPYGPDGLKVFLRNALDSGAPAVNVRVYVVTTTHRALKIIQNSQLAHGVRSEEPEGDDGVAGADLF